MRVHPRLLVQLLVTLILAACSQSPSATPIVSPQATQVSTNSGSTATSARQPTATISSALSTRAKPSSAAGRWGGEPVESVDWSPIENLLAIGTRDELYLYDGKTYQPVFTITTSAPNVLFSPDGKLATWGHDDSLNLWRPGDGSLDKTILIPGLSSSVHEGVAFSPDGHQIATSDSTGVVQIWDIGKGTQLHSFETGADLVKALAWNDAGNVIALETWRRASGYQGVQLRTPSGSKLKGDFEVGQPVFLRDGHTLLIVSYQCLKRVQYDQSGVSDSGPNCSEGNFFDRHVRLSPDGKYIGGILITGTGGVKFTSGEDLPMSLGVGDRSGTGAAFAPDSKRFVASFGTGSVAIYDVEQSKVTELK